MTPLFAALLFQTRPWTPPATTVPRAFVDATAFLLAHGMGDPRGGEFREATVETVGFLRPTQRIEVRGWVVGERVVTTDGLTYRVVGVGKPADLEEELSKRLPEFARPDARGQRFQFLTMDGERRYVTGAVLLVAGRSDLAERAVSGSFKPSDSTGMFRSFLAGWYHQAIAAHEAGQDAETAAIGGRLLRERAAFAAEALRLAGPSLAANDRGRSFGTNEPYSFLEPLSRLVKDAERRLAHPRPPLDLAALSKRPSDERISALIDHLDEEAAQQTSQPGAVPLEEDPIVRALVAEGDAAVPALFEAMARDERLTRSVGYWRDYFPDRSLTTVREAAYAAFRQIAVVRPLPPLGDLPALREFWEANGKLAPAERQLRLLESDGAGLFGWIEAERSLFGDGGSAEALRTTHGAALRDLLARRARELAAQVDADGLFSSYRLDLALGLSVDLARWSPREALPTVQFVTKRAMAPGVSLEWLTRSFARAIVVRGDLEGAPAWRAYADWVEATRLGTGAKSDPDNTEAFLPLFERRDVPEIRPEFRSTLISPESPWSIARGARSIRTFSWLGRYLFSPLLDDAEYFEAVQASLGDKVPVGNATLAAGNDIVWFRSERGGYGRKDPRVVADPLRPPAGQEVPVRACDQVATVLTNLKGAPAYRPYWPEAKRDEAIAALRTFLRQNAGHLATRLPTAEPHSPGGAAR